jgi:hypothetical protein
MIIIEAPWEAQLNWAEDCKRDSYVFDAIDNQISGPVSMDEAVLVAAAPDLLAACEAMYKYDQSDWEDEDTFFDLYETAMVLMKAAIKKAKGE